MQEALLENKVGQLLQLLHLVALRQYLKAAKPFIEVVKYLLKVIFDKEKLCTCDKINDWKVET